MKESCGCEASPKVATVDATPAIAEGKSVSLFTVPKMDCPSEENIIRMSLGEVKTIHGLKFDLAARHVRIVHEGDPQPISERLAALGLGASLLQTFPATPEESSAIPAGSEESSVKERRTLRLLLAINGAMFLLEIIIGWWAQSAGLIADSLDMFADAAVYGLALFAVGRSAQLKLRAAHLSGWLQMVLVLGVIGEVVRRFFYGSEPESLWMIGMATMALIANACCLLLISRERDSGVHMKASWIFSANDVLANMGVIVAGILVYWTESAYPDLIIGTLIGVIVLNGARRILLLKT